MPLLSNGEIHNIFLKNTDGDSNRWMHKLFFSLRPLVISRTKNFKNYLHIEDLNQEFNLALWTAIKTFDCHRHFDFYRWANWHFSNASRNFKKKYRAFKSINLEDKAVEKQEIVVLTKQILSCKFLSDRERRIFISIYR